LREEITADVNANLLGTAGERGQDEGNHVLQRPTAQHVQVVPPALADGGGRRLLRRAEAAKLRGLPVCDLAPVPRPLGQTLASARAGVASRKGEGGNLAPQFGVALLEGQASRRLIPRVNADRDLRFTLDPDRDCRRLRHCSTLLAALGPGPELLAAASGPRCSPIRQRGYALERSAVNRLEQFLGEGFSY